MAGAPAPGHLLPSVARVSHGDLYLSAPAPNGSLVSGELLSEGLDLRAVNGTASMSGDIVSLPPTQLFLPVYGGTVSAPFGGVNATLPGAGDVNVSPGPPVPQHRNEPFSGNGSSTITSSGVAVMAMGSVLAAGVEIRARWVLVPPDGSVVLGPWGPWAVVFPALLAQLSPRPARDWVPGEAYPICLAGGIANRTFSLHVSLATPGSQVDLGSFTTPSNTTAPYCWSATIPTTVPAQTAFGHLWEYGNVTYLLFVFALRIDNGSPAPPSRNLVAWLPWIGVGAGGVAILALLLAVIVRGPARSRGTSGTGPTTGPPAGATVTPPPPEPERPS